MDRQPAKQGMTTAQACVSIILTAHALSQRHDHRTQPDVNRPNCTDLSNTWEMHEVGGGGKRGGEGEARGSVTHPSWKQPSLLEEPRKAAFQYIHQKFLVLISAFQWDLQAPCHCHSNPADHICMSTLRIYMLTP